MNSNDYHDWMRPEDADRIGIWYLIYVLGWLMTVALMGVWERHGLGWFVPLAAFGLRAVVEIFVLPVAIRMRNPVLGLLKVMNEDYASYQVYLLFLLLVLPAQSVAFALWGCLHPNSCSWGIADFVARFLTVILPAGIWIACQKPPKYGKRWKKEQATKPTPAWSPPAYSYKPSAPEPWPVRPPEPTPLEKELARIDAEAREFNLDPDLVVAEKDRARAEFGSRNGTH
jgi:hypothetical protein